MAIKIITDSTSYISDDIVKELDIRRVSLNIAFEDVSIRETDIDNVTFYEMMKEKGIPTSSQPSIGELYEEMKRIVEIGDNVVCIFLSSLMSGTYASAFIVRDMILEKFSNAEVHIIDSKSNCMQLGYAAIAAAKAAAEGEALSDVIRAAEDNIKRSRFLFVPENLEYLKKGGRIGGAGALIGNLLKIIPILTVENGTTSVLMKVRTKKNAINTMVDKMMRDINDFGLKEVMVHHINCYDEALELSSRIKELLNIRIPICDIGPVIGHHVGPGAIGIVYYTEKNIR